MKALSIKQPWAWLIAAGYKDIENRAWPTNFKARIYIHAGKQPDSKGAWAIWGDRTFMELLDDIAKIQIPNLTTFWDKSAIIGEADIVDCVTQSKSPWFVGPYGFVLANPTLYQKPIPCRGKLGFFDPDLK